MIIRDVTLENFGLYDGRVEIPLAPRQDSNLSRPIVLIGGRNGAGKTTILEAVRLTLYGRRALGSRVGQSEYDDYVRSRLHRGRSALEKGQCAVGMTFDFAEAGNVHCYRIRRSWLIRPDAVVEQLELEKDGLAVSSVPRDEWQHFVQELIPPGVSQLFFFDGEKIREIAEDGHDEEQLTAAIKGLLGIELIERLRTDVGLFIARHQRAENATQESSELAQVTRDIQLLERQLSLLTEENADLASVREGHARHADQCRRRFVAEGGELAAQREGLIARRSEVERRQTRLQNELRDLAGGALPLALAPKLLSAVRKQLEAAQKASDATINVRALKAVLRSWKSKDEPRRTARWNAAHWSDLSTWVEALAKESRAKSRVAIESNHVALIGAFAAADDASQRAAQLATAMVKCAAELSDLDGKLLRSDNNATDELLRTMLDAENRLGRTEADVAAKEAALAEVRVSLQSLDRRRRKLLDDQARTLRAGEQVGLAGRVSGVLAKYEQRLLERKVSQLRAEFRQCFGQLLRKSDLVRDVAVDPSAFRVTLLDRHGNPIDKSLLSAGEKQVYATAMLWALARTSGRALPMIIDTPLARLDSEHRDNLLERYFPSASHQVVMLSTDTEVSNIVLKKLENQVSHTLRLDYVPATGSTVVREGYFGAESESDWDAGRELQQA